MLQTHIWRTTPSHCVSPSRLCHMMLRSLHAGGSFWIFRGTYAQLNLQQNGLYHILGIMFNRIDMIKWAIKSMKIKLDKLLRNGIRLSHSLLHVREPNG
jgi:hypothetical protein